MGLVTQIGERDFDVEVGQSSLPVVVDFYAEWCGPCRILSPILESFANELAKKIKFVKVNVDLSPQLASNFGIQSIPTLITFREGKPVDKLVGVGSPAQLRELMNNLVTNTSAATGR